MGWVRAIVSDELELKFRKIAMEKFGYKKGSITKALEEAIQEYIKKNKNE